MTPPAVPYAEVIGDPIEHSKSPLIHLFWLEKIGIEGAYRATRVKPGELQAFLHSRRSEPGWRGCNVTLPHKQAIIAELDAVEDQGIGAVNCVVASGERLIGRNTDVDGLAEALEEIDRSAPVAMIGAGGAARAGLAALNRLAVPEVRIVARDRGAAEALLGRFGVPGRVFPFADAGAALAGCGGVINASPLGMKGYPDMPEDVLGPLPGLRAGGFALDMVYAPLRTPFLEQAEAAGLRSIDGLAMLIGQAAEAFRMFFGAEPPRAGDGALRALLTR